MAEFTNLGKHCKLAECQQLDFLPFDCDGCGLIFCKLHKAKDSHSCSQILIKDERPEYHGPKGISCFYPKCQNRELVPIPCPNCKICYCLQHRFAVDHDCKCLPEESLKEESKTSVHIKEILASKQPISKKPLKKGSKSAKTAAKVAVMKMKLSATGDKGIPDTEKMYFHVYLPQTSCVKSKAFYFSKEWSIGRVIDFIATSTGLTNSNNICTTDNKKLRLFNCEDGMLLPTEDMLQTVIENETIPVYNGSNVILEYVLDTCDVLSDYKLYTT